MSSASGVGEICGCPGPAPGLRALQGKQQDEVVPAGTSHAPGAPRALCTPPPWAGCSCEHLQCPESPVQSGGFPKHLLPPRCQPLSATCQGGSGLGEESGWGSAGCPWTGRLEGAHGPRVHPTEPGIVWPLGWFLTPLGELSPSHVPGTLPGCS